MCDLNAGNANNASKTTPYPTSLGRRPSAFPISTLPSFITGPMLPWHVLVGGRSFRAGIGLSLQSRLDVPCSRVRDCRSRVTNHPVPTTPVSLWLFTLAAASGGLFSRGGQNAAWLGAVELACRKSRGKAPRQHTPRVTNIRKKKVGLVTRRRQQLRFPLGKSEIRSQR